MALLATVPGTEQDASAVIAARAELAGLRTAGVPSSASSCLSEEILVEQPIPR